MFHSCRSTRNVWTIEKIIRICHKAYNEQNVIENNFFVEPVYLLLFGNKFLKNSVQGNVDDESRLIDNNIMIQVFIIASVPEV